MNGDHSSIAVDKDAAMEARLTTLTSNDAGNMCISGVIDVVHAECEKTLKSIVDRIIAKWPRAKKEEEKAPRLDLFCFCGYGDGFMVYCDGEERFCPGNNWFHLECVGLRCEPRGNWKCHFCTKRAIECEERRKSQRKRGHDVMRNTIALDESKFVLSKENLKKKQLSNPLKVDAAEQQSRKNMVTFANRTLFPSLLLM